MAVRIKCPGCGKPLKVQDGFAGKKGKCPACGYVFVASARSLTVAETDRASVPWKLLGPLVGLGAVVLVAWCFFVFRDRGVEKQPEPAASQATVPELASADQTIPAAPAAGEPIAAPASPEVSPPKLPMQPVVTRESPRGKVTIRCLNSTDYELTVTLTLWPEDAPAGELKLHPLEQGLLSLRRGEFTYWALAEREGSGFLGLAGKYEIKGPQLWEFSVSDPGGLAPPQLTRRVTDLTKARSEPPARAAGDTERTPAGDSMLTYQVVRGDIEEYIGKRVAWLARWVGQQQYTGPGEDEVVVQVFAVTDELPREGLFVFNQTDTTSWSQGALDAPRGALLVKGKIAGAYGTALQFGHRAVPGGSVPRLTEVEVALPSPQEPEHVAFATPSDDAALTYQVVSKDVEKYIGKRVTWLGQLLPRVHTSLDGQPEGYLCLAAADNGESLAESPFVVALSNLELTAAAEKLGRTSQFKDIRLVTGTVARTTLTSVGRDVHPYVPVLVDVVIDAPGEAASAPSRRAFLQPPGYRAPYGKHTVATGEMLPGDLYENLLAVLRKAEAAWPQFRQPEPLSDDDMKTMVAILSDRRLVGDGLHCEAGYGNYGGSYGWGLSIYGSPPTAECQYVLRIYPNGAGIPFQELRGLFGQPRRVEGLAGVRHVVYGNVDLLYEVPSGKYVGAAFFFEAAGPAVGAQTRTPGAQRPGRKSGRFWREVESVEFGEKSITAGTQLRLEPMTDELTVTPGSARGSAEQVAFRCFLLTAEGQVQYRIVKAFIVNEPAGQSMGQEVQYRRVNSEFVDTLEWPAKMKEQVITTSFPAPPLGMEYSGRGVVYFYLDDGKGNCISNIIDMQVQFR